MIRRELEYFFGALRFFTRLPVPVWVGHSAEALDRSDDVGAIAVGRRHLGLTGKPLKLEAGAAWIRNGNVGSSALASFQTLPN